MLNIQEFFIGQVFRTPEPTTDSEGNTFHPAWENYPPEAAMWCNENNAYINDNGDGTFTIMAIPEPTQAEIDAARVKEIDAELDAMSSTPTYKRAYDEMAEAMAAGVEPSEKAKSDILKAAMRKQELRAERATLTGE